MSNSRTNIICYHLIFCLSLCGHNVFPYFTDIFFPPYILFFLCLITYVYFQMIELNVLTPPIAQLSMMVSSRHVPRSTMISNGHFVRMTCSTWGYPPPTISWFKNGILHVESGRHQYTNNNTSSEFAAEDLVITSLVLSDMVCSNFLRIEEYRHYLL